MVGEDVFRLVRGGTVPAEAGREHHRAAAVATAAGDGSGTPAADPFRRRVTLAFLVFWAALAVAPANRVDWLAENLLVAGLLGALYVAREDVRLSRASTLAVFAFLASHAVGAHYTYPGVPYDAWLETLTGTTSAELFGFERNHYDRLVHLLFGLLLTQPMREALMQTSPVRGRWSYLLPVAVSMAASSGYEVAEWWIAVAFGGDLGAAFVGAQGDVWDAQKDMALAAGGAMLAMTVVTNLDHARARAATASRTVVPDVRSGGPAPAPAAAPRA